MKIWILFCYSYTQVCLVDHNDRCICNVPTQFLPLLHQYILLLVTSTSITLIYYVYTLKITRTEVSCKNMIPTSIPNRSESWERGWAWTGCNGPQARCCWIQTALASPRGIKGLRGRREAQRLIWTPGTSMTLFIMYQPKNSEPEKLWK